MRFSLHIFFLLMVQLALVPAIGQGVDKALQEQAEQYFAAENYSEALPLYSQLLSLNVQDPDYNFHFGACQLFVNSDKKEGLKYLKFATEQASPPPLAYYYYGLGLHLNYRFDRAIDQYQKYKPLANKKDREAQEVDHQIEMCVSGKNLVSNFTDISVIQKEVLPRRDFFRNYDLTSIGGKIIVKPEEFMSDEDKKRDERFLMYFQQSSDIIYYASYSEKAATGKDLFYITKLPTGEWGQPKSVGAVLNTTYDEDFPFNHPDGNTLYFASKGHNSMGGYDIFKSTKAPDGSWTQPKNMEFAINTPWDDFMFITDEGETSAWFASNRANDHTKVTVYKIGIQRVPLDLTLIKGQFQNEGSRLAKITVEDVIQNKVVGVFTSDAREGNYLLDIRGSGKYNFVVEAEESDKVHTGVVEVPKEKGLKQFRQKMLLVDVDGKEQLQIINMFDEPIDDENLMTAELLEKQASLDVNASESDIVVAEGNSEENTETTESSASTIDKAQAVGELEQAITKLSESSANNLKKATAAYNRAEEKSTGVPSEMDIAEAAIASELATIYAKQADEEKNAALRMEQFLDNIEEAGTDQASIEQKYNQFIALNESFETDKTSDSALESEFRKRVESLTDLEVVKQKQADDLLADVEGIDEEIAYYQTEIETTKDAAIREELEAQIAEAEKALPEKQRELNRAQKELTALKSQIDDANRYLALASEIIITASGLAATISTPVSTSEIKKLDNEIATLAEENAALLTLVNPSKGMAAAEAQLAEARVATTESETESAKTSEAAKETTEATDNLNSEIRDIQESNNNAEALTGNYSSTYAEQLAAIDEENDPLLAETQKAEIYDQWVESIENEISDLSNQRESATGVELEAINKKIGVLTEELNEKEFLGSESYAKLAELNDQAADASTVDAPSTETPSEEKTVETPVVSTASVQAEANKIEAINESFRVKLEEASDQADPELKAQTLAALNKQWSEALLNELNQLSTSLANADDLDLKIDLENLIESVSEQRIKRQQNASEQQQLANKLIDEKRQRNEQLDTQTELSKLVTTSYNPDAFEDAADQIGTEPNESVRRTQSLMLGRTWLLAIQNEETTQKAKLAQAVDTAQVLAIEARLAELQEDKVAVKQKMEAIEAGSSDTQISNVNEARPTDNFVGFKTVTKKAEAEAIENQQALDQASLDISEKIGQLEEQLDQTKKKKDRAAIEAKLTAATEESEMLMLEAEHYQEVRKAVNTLEDRLLTLEPGQKTPAEEYLERAKWSKTDATLVEAELLTLEEGLDGIKKKKERKLVEAEIAEKRGYFNKMKRKSETAMELADMLSELQEEAIQRNYIILPGREVELPVVNTDLNPNEVKDIVATPEYQAYNEKITKAIQMEAEAAAIRSREMDTRQLAKESLQNANRIQIEALNTSNTARKKELQQRGLALADEAYTYFTLSDSLAEDAAILEREAQFARNKTNAELLTQPEQVYENVLAVYNETYTPSVAVAVADEETKPETTPEPILQTEEAPVAENSQQEEIPVAQETKPQSTKPQEQFQLDAPTQNQQKVEIIPDVLSNTIFELDKDATSSAYSASNPIPIDQKLPSGLIYKVQIGAFRNPISPETFKGMKPLLGESTGSGFTRYSAGLFNSPQAALIARDEVREIGYTDAFVVAYLNGSRISMAEAESYAARGTTPARTVAQSSSTASTPPVVSNSGGPLQVKNVSGISGSFFTVQVGVYSKPLTNSNPLGLSPLNQESLSNGLYRYTYGVYQSKNAAEQAKEQIRSNGIQDAFVTAYRDGTRIDADALSSGSGTSSRPANPVASPTVLYRVFLGEYTGDIPVRQASIILELSTSGVQKESRANDVNAYYYGQFSSESEAKAKADELRQKGLSQAKAVLK